LALLPPSRRQELASSSDLDEVLTAQYRTAAATWSTFELPREHYLAALAKRVAARADEPAERVVRDMPAGDLYLVAACEAGDPLALAAFRDAHLPALVQALAKLGMPPTQIDDEIQHVLVMVLVGEQRPPQLGEFRGRGTLRSWLRTIAVRTGRRALGLAASSNEQELEDLPAAVGDPELELLRARYREEVRRAFAAGFAGLGERERNVLKQYYLDGLTIDQLAALYQVNRATTARWVAGARLALVAGTRTQLIEQFGIAAAEVDSIIRLVRSQLDISVREIAR
jgi:RNA polymerase sigma-70 factor (ECF subfamily)